MDRGASRYRDFDLIQAGPFLSLAYDSKDRVKLAQRELDSGRLVATVDLGPGYLWKRSQHARPEWAGFHPQFAGIIPVADAKNDHSASVRFVMVATPGNTASGAPTLVNPPLALDIPAPCPANSPCSYVVVAIQAIDPAHFLVVYDIRGEHQFTAVTTIANPAFVAPPEQVPPVPSEAGPLEEQCARLWSCYRKSPETDFAACLAYWSRIHTGGPVPDLAYASFLATPSGCAAFTETYRGALVASATPCAPGCVGPMAIQCTGDGRSVRDCRYHGVACRVGADGAGVCGPEVTCGSELARCEGHTSITCAGDAVVSDCAALGLVCDAAAPATCQPATCATTGVCDGTVLNEDACAERQDCARLGLACDEAGARCSGGGSACHTELRCDGDNLTYCLEGAARTIDCKRIGFRTCARDEPYGDYGCVD